MDALPGHSSRNSIPMRFIGTWAAWTLGSYLACAIALVLSLGVVLLLSLNADHWLAPFFLFFFIVLLGGVQARILYRGISRSVWWIPATIAGWAVIPPIVWLISLIIPDGLVEVSGQYATFVIAGLTTGISQWLFLRRYWRHAGWWLPASALGSLILALVLGPVITSLYELSLMGLVPYMVTGLAVAWLAVDSPGG